MSKQYIKRRKSLTSRRTQNECHHLSRLAELAMACDARVFSSASNVTPGKSNFKPHLRPDAFNFEIALYVGNKRCRAGVIIAYDPL